MLCLFLHCFLLLVLTDCAYVLTLSLSCFSFLKVLWFNFIAFLLMNVLAVNELAPDSTQAMILDESACDVCFNQFDDADHRPLVMHGGHSLCQSCVPQLERRGNKVSCPTCVES